MLRAARAMESRLKDEGRLIYAGAGTSGRLAVQDGAELMPTFSWPSERLVLLIAGGQEALIQAVEGAEDEVKHAQDLIKKHKVGEADVLIVRSTKVTRPMLEGGKISLVIRAGAGTNTIDVEAASERGIWVANCPGKNAVAVAELTLALMLALDRRVVRRLDVDEEQVGI